MSYPYADLRDYLAALDKRGLLTTVAATVNKDTELVPLVRLQFRGLPQGQRRGFHFTSVTDSRGRTFGGSIAIATFAASREIYDLAHLGTLTRNELRFAGTPAAVPVLSEPTSEQRQAFELIGAAISLTLHK